MNLLAIDTTTETCSVAVLWEDRCIEHTRFAPRLHNRHVLGMVDDGLRAAGIAVRAVDMIAFGGGPGSFTGVRIGAAVSQGIALATGAKLIRVANSAVAAETVRRVTGRRGEVDLCRASRPGWLYRARYRLGDNGVRCVEFDQLVDSKTMDNDFVDGDQLAVSARIVGALARSELAGSVAPAFAQPYYVDGDSPWQPSNAGKPLPK